VGAGFTNEEIEEATVMTRTSAKMTTLLAGAALLIGAAAVNCSRSGSSDSIGTMHLALTLPNGTTVSSVSWQIMSSGGAVIRSGTINTSDQNATPSVDTSCPAGTGDTVTLSATTSDNKSCTGTSAPFNVVAGGTTMVAVTLLCGGTVPTQPNGSVIVNGTVVQGDNCPLLTSWVASPLQTSQGGNIDVAATATDADASDVLSFSWTATAGTFVMPSAASTQYTCVASGAQTLTITVSDNHSPTPCTTAMTFPVNCVQVSVCGNGVVETGEQCEPPNTATCSATCQNIPPPPVCGNGIVETGEQCEPPNTPTCSATCQSITPPPMCAVNACISCEAADTLNCPAALNVVPGATCFGCEGFPAGSKSRTDCQALLSCIRANPTCMAGDDPTPCLCGTVAAGACASGTPGNGPCVAQYNAAASDATGTVFSQFSNPTTPVGIANNNAACDDDSACACP
jgi:hypothetical protein